MPILAPVKESIQIPDGKHNGVIADIRIRTEPYSYVDFWVTVDEIKDSNGDPVQIKEGCPLMVSKNSKLGRLLKRFGMSDKEIRDNYGKEIDIEKWVKIGQKVEFMTMTKEFEKAKFARIVEDSLKPAEE